MRALLLTNLYPSLREPTRGVFNRNRFQALSRYCETQIIAPVPWWRRARRPHDLLRAPQEVSSGLMAAFPTYWSIPRLPNAHAQGLRASLRPHLKRLRRTFPFDIILAAWAYPDGVAAAHLALEIGCPLVTMCLGSDINDFALRPGLRGQIQWALGRSERVVAVSSALRDRIVDLGISPERVIVQHNGVDGEQFFIQNQKDARERLRLPIDRKLICYAGNLKPEKGVDVLIEAMDRLVQGNMCDADLALVGGGEQEDRLRAEALSRGLAKRVRFYGRRPHAEIPIWIGASDVFCLPSRREGCPNVVLEALACGRPVVASEVGGVPELLSHASGVIVPPGDPAAMAAGLQEALKRDWKPEALRGSVQCLSWDHFGQTLHGILTEAVSQYQAVRPYTSLAPTPTPIFPQK